MNIDLLSDFVGLEISTPWYEKWRESFHQFQHPFDHEFTKHLIACIIVSYYYPAIKLIYL